MNVFFFRGGGDGKVPMCPPSPPHCARISIKWAQLTLDHTWFLFPVVNFDQMKGQFGFHVTLPPPSLTPPGAEEIIYEQVGQRVTLKPPKGFNSNNFYLYWKFNGQPLAWANHMKLHGEIESEQHI